MKWLKQLEEVFQLTRAERNGYFFLVLVICLLFFASWVIPYFFGNRSLDNSKLNQIVAAIELSTLEANQRKINTLSFDPNFADSTKMVNAGLKPWQARSVLKARAAGIVFSNPEDLLQVYNLNEADLLRIEPYVRINLDSASILAESLAESITPAIQENKNPPITWKIPPAFDPNLIGVDGWVQMGFSEKQSNTITNYIKAIGGLRAPEQLKKCYAISGEVFELMRPSIRLTAQESDLISGDLVAEPQVLKTENEVAKALLIDLQTANKQELMQLKGVGEYRAQRIIEYREKLGGFVSKKQLHEIRQLPEDLIESLLPQLFLSHVNVRKVKVNQVEFKEMMKHPYFDYAVTKELFRIRDEQGLIKRQNDIYSITFASDSLVRQLLPYIDFSP